MIPTIKDVAAHAGFSIATVSRAINAPHTVNPVTLDKVRQSIDALNFRPSPLVVCVKQIASYSVWPWHA
jgi:DNA-binding LacI/PurR family transcriptional regulator